MTKRARKPPPRGSLRVIGGLWRGRRIALDPGAQVRPTPNRVRETLFNWLAPRIAGARCLDLFAGSGALGIEALSRGAREVTFVDSNARVAHKLKGELERLGACASIVRADAEAFVRSYRGPGFDIVFVDPPYELPVDALLVALAGVLAPDARVYLERARADGLPELAWGSWVKRGQAASVCFGLAACA